VSTHSANLLVERPHLIWQASQALVANRAWAGEFLFGDHSSESRHTLHRAFPEKGEGLFHLGCIEW